MRVRYRTIAFHPTQIRSPTSETAAHKERVNKDGSVDIQSVRVADLYCAIPLALLSALELCRTRYLHTIDVAPLFNVLKDMPLLQDLAIDFDAAVPPLRLGDLPLLPFNLRRLVVCPLFPGAAHLLRNSNETLECLVLGCPLDERPSHAQVLTDLSRFIKLRALRLQTTPDPQFLASASPYLCALAIPSNLDFVGGISQQLTCLTVLYSKFDDDKARTLAEALSLFPALRTLDIETDGVDECPDAKDAGWTALADVCRARGICVSVMWARAPAKWEKLEGAPTRPR